MGKGELMHSIGVDLPPVPPDVVSEEKLETELAIGLFNVATGNTAVISPGWLVQLVEGVTAAV